MGEWLRFIHAIGMICLVLYGLVMLFTGNIWRWGYEYKVGSLKDWDERNPEEE